MTALDRLFARNEGQALVRLLADAVAGALPSLAAATEDWCEDIRSVIVVRLRADEPGTDFDIADAAARFLAPEFDALAEELFTAALGRACSACRSSLCPRLPKSGSLASSQFHTD